MTLRHCCVLCVLIVLTLVGGVRTAEAQCTATVSPTSVSVSSVGSTSAVSVTTGTNCFWMATSSVSWITVTSGATGAGIGQVNYSVAANTTTAIRVGTLTVAGQTVTITQATASCSFTVTPTTVSVPSIASAYTLSVVSGTSCSWTAVSNVSWITVTAGASGSAIGSVSFNVAATTTPRTGTLTVAGQTVTVTQAGDSCVYTVTPTSVSVLSIGSASALSVSTGASCSWTATSSVNWITITGGASGSGISAVNYTVAANATSAPRTGTIDVAGQTVTFTQAAGSCVYTVTPTSVSVSSIGSTSALSVSTGASCSWTATSSVNWITITGGASGSGISAVNYTVAANATTAVRTGTLTVAGQTVTFTQAAGSCVYTVTPTTLSAASTGNTFTLSVTSGTSCAWTAVSSASWITVTAGASGSGTGAVTLTVAATTTARTGTLTVAGRTVTVTEDAPTRPLPPTNLRIVRWGS